MAAPALAVWIGILFLGVFFLLALVHDLRWRSRAAMTLYLGQCDVALEYPRFSNPELMKLNTSHKTADGEKETFECYEWFVARLVYVLDEALRINPSKRWRAVARTQLANHSDYFGSAYYRKQDYFAHYSARMRRLIEEARRD